MEEKVLEEDLGEEIIKERMEYVTVDAYNTRNFQIVYNPYCWFKGSEDFDWEMSIVNNGFDTYREAVEFSLELIKHPDNYIMHESHWRNFTNEEKEKIHNIDQINIIEELFSRDGDGYLEFMDGEYVGSVYKYYPEHKYKDEENKED